jgi:hypothetical protein
MTLAGGGWTTLFAGRNGSPNVFDHFDTGSFAGVCTDPATKCLARGQSFLGDSATDVALSCGSVTLTFPLTEQARSYLINGTQQSWIQISATPLAGVQILPNLLYTGSGADLGFRFSNGGNAGGNTFASSYNSSATNIWNYCNGSFDEASQIWMGYREAAPVEVKNTQATAGVSCRALRDQILQAVDGIYWLQQADGQPYQAYCDMSTDGGGWTAVFAGRNGSTNVFDHFDPGSYQGICTDPATRCLQHAPSTLPSGGTAELAVSCNGAMVAFGMTSAAHDFLVSGTESNWIGLLPTFHTGMIGPVPNTLYTGSGGDLGFRFSNNGNAGGNTFASSYNSTATNIWDYCNGIFDQSSLVRVYYRESP